MIKQCIFRDEEREKKKKKRKSHRSQTAICTTSSEQ